jgi:hypothetical protein
MDEQPSKKRMAVNQYLKYLTENDNRIGGGERKACQGKLFSPINSDYYYQ